MITHLPPIITKRKFLQHLPMEIISRIIFPCFSSLVLFVFIFSIFFRQIVKGYRKYQSKLPPGPQKLPFIGNLHQLAGAGWCPPWHIFQDLSRKHGPIMQLQVGQITTFVVSSPRLAKEVIKTHDLTFADRPDSVAAEILFYNKHNTGFAPYGDYWRQMRKLCFSELLSNKKVSDFASLREKEVFDLITSIRSERGSPINLTKKFFFLSNTITCKAVFGDNFNRTEEIIALMTGVAYFLGKLSVADVFPSLKLLDAVIGTKRKLKRIHRQVDCVLSDIINDCRKNMLSTNSSQQNLLAALIRFQQSGGYPIPDDTIKSIVFEMFAAGTEPTSTLIEWAFSEIMKNPKVTQFVQAEVRQVLGQRNTIQDTNAVKKLEYLKMVIKETLRLHPPAPLLIPRQCRETCEIDGYTIPANTKVMVNAWAIGRDPGSWDDADTFRPERFENSSMDFKGNCFEFLPFGAGRRMCPGMSFAISIAEICLAKLMYHFDWELPKGTNPVDLNMEESSGFVGRRKI